MNTLSQDYSKPETKDVKDIDELIDEPSHSEKCIVSEADQRVRHEERLKFERELCSIIDSLNKADLSDTGATQNVVSNNFTEARKLKRGLSGIIDGLKVSALADTGAAQNVVSSNFARARRLDVAGSPSSFRQGNSKLAHSLGTLKNRFANMTK